MSFPCFPFPVLSEIKVLNYWCGGVLLYRRKIAEATKALNIDIMSPIREGKRLLVLDLDYAILDTALWKEQNFVATRE